MRPGRACSPYWGAQSANPVSSLDLTQGMRGPTLFMSQSISSAQNEGSEGFKRGWWAHFRVISVAEDVLQMAPLGPGTDCSSIH